MNEVILVAVAFLSSAFAGIAGVGGGVLLISVMVFLVPPDAIVPLHGAVMVFSNISRGLFDMEHIKWKIFGQFLSGAILGTLLGYHFLRDFPVRITPLLLGSFILIVTWMPMTSLEARIPLKFSLLGFIKTFLALFVGATGPLVMPFMLREDLRRDEIVASSAVLGTTTHILKIITFGILGFAFTAYLPVLGGMIICAMLGSYVGKRLRGRVPEKPFRQFVRMLLTASAINMILKVLLN